ncbi:MAG: hypothetical protein QXN59_01045 [Candidatus Micrarchaeaceae archaeon]
MARPNTEPDEPDEIKKLNKFIAKLVGNIASKDLSKGITFKIDKYGNLEIGTPSDKDEGMNPEPVKSEREPAYDIIDCGDTIQIVMEMPGMCKDGIRISSEGRKLIIYARNMDRYYSKELFLPCDIGNELTDNFNNGVLEIKVKKAHPKS